MNALATACNPMVSAQPAILESDDSLLYWIELPSYNRRYADKLYNHDKVQHIKDIVEDKTRQRLDEFNYSRPDTVYLNINSINVTTRDFMQNMIKRKGGPRLSFEQKAIKADGRFDTTTCMNVDFVVEMIVKRACGDGECEEGQSEAASNWRIVMLRYFSRNVCCLTHTIKSSMISMLFPDFQDSVPKTVQHSILPDADKLTYEHVSKKYQKAMAPQVKYVNG